MKKIGFVAIGSITLVSLLTLFKSKPIEVELVDLPIATSNMKMTTQSVPVETSVETREIVQEDARIVALKPTAKPEIEEAEEVKDQPEKALEFFENIAALPGAYDLAWDIRTALEADPTAFRYDAITKGEANNFELREDYLVAMIPDPELRTKWQELMAIVATSQME